MLESKCAIKPALTRQPCDRSEPHEDADNGNAERLQYVVFLVMADFVCQYGFQFRLGKLGYECVEKDNFAKTAEPGEESVGVAGPFTAVHYFDAASWKIGALRQCKEAFTQRALRQRRELVKERHDHRRGDQHQKQLERDDDRRRPNPPVWPGPL